MSCRKAAVCVLITFLMVALCLSAHGQCRIDINPPLAAKVTWSYVSENSIAIGVETTQAAKTYVEYGPTDRYGSKTAETDAHFQHPHHVSGLKTGEVVHYRVVAIGADGKKVATADATFTPKAVEAAVRVPDDVEGPPYILNKANTTYIVTKDLSCPGKAFEIAASDVTLDLNGHTVTYDDDPAFPRPNGAWNVMRDQAPMGVRVVVRGKGIRILNGAIRQGKGNHAGMVPGVGYNPVFISSAATEIAGIHAVWTSDDTGGFFLHGGDGFEVHHCVTEDLGSGITNRHQAICNIGYAANGEVHHNLVKRSRHRGINAFGSVHHNEVHVDSQATNAFAVDAPKGKPCTIHDNRLFGKGEHPIGIGATGDVRQLRVYGNVVDVQNTQGGTEYGSTGSACYRMTWGGEVDDVEVFDNVFILHAKKDAFEYNGRKMDSHGRAVWIGLPVKNENPKRTTPRVLMHHNTVIANNAGDGAKAAGIAIVCLNETPWLVFEDNRVESNYANVVLSDSYGHSAGFPKFIHNTFVKVGNQPNYATIANEYTDRTATAEMIDNRYEDGASPDSIRWRSGAPEAKEVRFSHLVTVKVTGGVPGAPAEVTVTDKDGKAVFTGQTDENGQLTAAVSVRSVTPVETKTYPTHTFGAQAGGRKAEATVDVDKPMTVSLVLR